MRFNLTPTATQRAETARIAAELRPLGPEGLAGAIDMTAALLDTGPIPAETAARLANVVRAYGLLLAERHPKP